MPDIIDNIKVGEYIKKLLKSKNMTQDDLAEALCISKSAVSQNLRGKSTFDIQNLFQIAKIFEITLDDLLNLKSDETYEVISEYQKVVNQGLPAIQKVAPQDLRMYEPDMYGKVLVDYIVESRKLEMLTYLIDEEVMLVEDYYHRAKPIYLKVIKYLLEEKQYNFGDFIMKYTELHGSFHIEDEAQGLIIWGLLNQEHYQDFMAELIKYKPSLKARWFSKGEDKEKLPMTRIDYIEVIAKYQLSNILKTLMRVQPRDDDFAFITLKFIEHHYLEGISIYINHFFKTPPSSFKRSSLDCQKAFMAVLKSDHFDLIADFAAKSLYSDMTSIVRQAIKNKQEQVYSHLIAQHHQEIIFKKIGETCVETSNLALLDQIMQYLTKDDLNYLVSWVKMDQIETLEFLLQKGARIDEKYYNLETFKKVNKLIDHILKKGE
jgi:transcriptional regulator with XRE-family HTH domain/phosphoribosyl-ATP pyrophosphohydrolase